MADNDNGNFEWKPLLTQIQNGRVIPVIGHGLYYIEIEQGGDKKECLLYDYLAELLNEKSEEKIDPNHNHRFARACLSFLKEHNQSYLDLSSFLSNSLKDFHCNADPRGSLQKLAMIKNFKWLITTAYHDHLERAIKKTRVTDTVSLSNTLKKNTDIQDIRLTKYDNTNATLIIHLLGTLGSSFPEFTERDILETTVFLQQKKTDTAFGIFFQSLGEKILLFIGCGFEDWLFRFFARAVNNQEFQYSPYINDLKLIAADNFGEKKNVPPQELFDFFQDHGISYYHCTDIREFVDTLFDEYRKFDPDGIIKEINFPSTAFISFIGEDREIARRLTENLRSDGISVWFDNEQLRGGEDIDKKIYHDIRKSHAFIQLVSKKSQIERENGEERYHVIEARWAKEKNYFNNDLEILPVAIDDIDIKKELVVDTFKNYFHFHIKDGLKEGEDYNKLLDKLRDIQDRR